jgi:hypothetical protein
MMQVTDDCHFNIILEALLCRLHAIFMALASFLP